MYLQDLSPPTEICVQLSFHHHTKKHWPISVAFLVVFSPTWVPTNTADCCVDPPNYRGVAHVLTAFLSAADETKLPDDANRFIGQTDCVGTSRDDPNVAAGIVVWNHIIVIKACTISSQINSNSDNRY